MPDLDRRRFFSVAATTIAASQVGMLAFPRRLEVMTGSTSETSTDAARETGSASDLRPFRVSFPEEQLTDLRRRIKATKWPERETVPDDTQGVRLATMQALASYWAENYDWRKVEAKLNSYPNFITNIDGMDIHFIHVKSKEKNALPMIVTHGWPGSVIEQLKIIDPLTNPTKYGGSAADAFDVVIPSIPGYGFSGKPTAPGWNPVRIAKTWVTLMRNLGYTKYVARAVTGATPSQRQWRFRRHPDCWGSPRTCQRRSRPRSMRRSALAGRSRLASPLTNRERGISSAFFTRTGSATPTKCRCVRKRSTRLGIHQSVSPHGFSIMMIPATR